MVSIVIPVYNRADIITKTIYNIFEQTYENYELIVVDDGSTDNIDEVMASIKNDRLRYIKSGRNMGACHARNLGVKHARGEFIAFQDSDDIWYPEKIAHQMACLMKTNADICLCRMLMRYEDGSCREFHTQGFSTKDITLENELRSNFISTQLILGKKSCFENTRFDETFPRYQDWDLGIRLVQNYKFCFLNEIMAERFLQKNSISANPQKGLQGGTKLLQKYSNEFEKYPKSFAEFLLSYAKMQEDCGISSKDTIVRSMKTCLTKKAVKYYLAQRTGFLQRHLKQRRGE